MDVCEILRFLEEPRWPYEMRKAIDAAVKERKWETIIILMNNVTQHLNPVLVYSAFVEAVTGGFVDMVKYFLPFQDHTGLCIGLNSATTAEVASVILTSDALTGSDVRCAMFKSIEKGFLDVTKVLLEDVRTHTDLNWHHLDTALRVGRYRFASIINRRVKVIPKFHVWNYHWRNSPTTFIETVANINNSELLARIMSTMTPAEKDYMMMKWCSSNVKHRIKMLIVARKLLPPKSTHPVLGNIDLRSKIVSFMY